MPARLFLIFIFSGLIQIVGAQALSTYQKESFIRGTTRLPYRILYPEHHDAEKAYPLVIFLHGSAQRGNDNERQLIHGGDFFLQDSIRSRYPSIVIFPQCGQRSSWSYFNFSFDTARRRVNLIFTFQEKPKEYALLVKELADSLVQSGHIDTNRIYIGGLSLGGFGTWDFTERYPGYFAAAFPICGGGDTSCAPLIAGKTAVWIFHGGSDPLVSVQYAREYYRSLQRVQADVRYREYPGVRHNSWVNAFKEPGLMEWLFSKSRDSNRPLTNR